MTERDLADRLQPVTRAMMREAAWAEAERDRDQFHLTDANRRAAEETAVALVKARSRARRAA